MRHVLWLIGLSLFMPWSAWAENASLLDMAVQDNTVEFLLSRPVSPQLFSLEPEQGKPFRVVIDFPATALSGRVASPAPDHRLVSALRVGMRNQSDLRVVLDLKNRAGFSGEWRKTKGESRLLIRLGQPTTPPPIQAAPPQTYHPSTIAIFPSAPKPAATPQAPVVPAPQAVVSAPLPVVAPAPVRAARAGRPVVVAVDAGHGGIDPGALGRYGSREKDIAFAISQALAGLINQEPGMRAVLIRDSDTFLSLRARTERARAYQADLFISIHADAGAANLDGASVYMLSQQGASSEAAKWLAEKENAADLVGGVRLSDKDDILASVLLDLSQAGTLEASGQLGNHVLEALGSQAPLHLRKVQQANFMVLRSPDIPSILVETGFISNPTEEQKLRTPAYQKQLAQSLFEGLRAYLARHAPPGTVLARQ